MPPSLGVKRKAVAPSDGKVAARYEVRIAREFPTGQAADEIRLRLFIEEWLAMDPAGAIHFFSQPGGALATQAPLFMQILTKLNAALAVETLLGWPASLRGIKLHGSNAATVCARVLGETVPNEWVGRLAELEKEFRTDLVAGGRSGEGFVSPFFRGWASRDAVGSLAASLQYPTQPYLYEVCHGVPPAQLRAALDWAATIPPAEAKQIIASLAIRYAKQDPTGARAFHESLPEALANDDRILETLGEGIVGGTGSTGTVDVASIPAALQWIDQAFPLGAKSRESVLRMLAAQLNEEPGGVRALISQTTDAQWSGREDLIKQHIQWEGGNDPSAMYAWLNTLDGPSRSAALGALWASRSPDELVSAAAAHPEDAGLRAAARTAAAALGVREELLAEHPELAK